MSKAKQLTSIGLVKSKADKLTTNTPESGRVIISFKYLYKLKSGCFDEISACAWKNRNREYFKELERFLFEAESNCKNISEMISQYTSRYGSKIYGNNNSTVNRILKNFRKAYPEDAGLLSDHLLHVHAKRGGKGMFVIYGVTYDSTFYVLGFDPNHNSL